MARTTKPKPDTQTDEPKVEEIHTEPEPTADLEPAAAAAEASDVPTSGYVWVKRPHKVQLMQHNLRPVEPTLVDAKSYHSQLKDEGYVICDAPKDADGGG